MIIPKVSVVIPNYNAEKYVLDCLSSVTKQQYGNLEIFIVDDGSTDNSVELLASFCENREDVQIICQQNMNASIARNVGLSNCTGKYVIFLDSDDILYPGALKKLVTNAEKSNADLVIGNFNKINENGKIIMTSSTVKRNEISEECYDYCMQVPNPSNKLYRMDVILKNALVWGNVRIGQDLNFYLKYLACISRISLITDIIYGWRVVEGSISNTFSFRIFDIVESFENTKKFYSKIKKYEIYNEYIEPLEYYHYYLQMEKQKKFNNMETRKIVIDYFSFFLNRMNVINRKNYIKVASDVKKCKIKIRMKCLYGSQLYTWLDHIFTKR